MGGVGGGRSSFAPVLLAAPPGRPARGQKKERRGKKKRPESRGQVKDFFGDFRDPLWDDIDRLKVEIKRFPFSLTWPLVHSINRERQLPLGCTL